MKFCSNCCGAVDLRIPDGDTLPRFICGACDIIFYQNPKMIVGCIPVWQNKILLCKRAIDPKYGKWTVPAGFLENNETAEQGDRGEKEDLEVVRAVVEEKIDIAGDHGDPGKRDQGRPAPDPDRSGGAPGDPAEGRPPAGGGHRGAHLRGRPGPGLLSVTREDT